MPIVRFFTSKNQLTRTFKDRIKYVINPKATLGYTYGKGLVTQETYLCMQIIKRLFRKTDGRLFIHFCVSYENYERLTPSIAHEIGIKIASCLKGFQLVMGTHVDTNHLHNHFLLNTVNVNTGMKFQQSPNDLENFKKLVNKVFYSYDLEPIIKFYGSNFNDEILDDEYDIKELYEITEIIDTDTFFDIMDYPNYSEWQMMSENENVGFAKRWDVFQPFINSVEYCKYQDHLIRSNMSEDEEIQFAEKYFNEIETDELYQEQKANWERHDYEEIVWEKETQKSFFNNINL